MSQDRMNVQVFGRIIGTASGWDQPTDFGLNFYDFQPNEVGVQFLGNNLNGLVDPVLFIDAAETGEAEVYHGKEGNEVVSFSDTLDFAALAKAERHTVA